jgi:hypothetical protein
MKWRAAMDLCVSLFTNYRLPFGDFPWQPSYRKLTQHMSAKRIDIAALVGKNMIAAAIAKEGL